MFRGDESRRRRGCHVDIPRGYSAETSRGDAAAATWIFRGDTTPCFDSRPGDGRPGEEDSKIEISSELFKFSTEDGCDEVTDAKIEDFLEKAGLSDRTPRLGADDYQSRNEEERRRWVYGDVIAEAVVLVRDKYRRPGCKSKRAAAPPRLRREDSVEASITP